MHAVDKASEERTESRFSAYFERFASYITRVTGSSTAFLLAFGIVIVWALTGPIFNYSETWQLVINTGTTIVTFLMVFVIQKAQNKESLAIQIKLNELIAATKGASNRLVDVEELSEHELRLLCDHYHTMAEMTRKASDLRQSHSVAQAKRETAAKLQDEKDSDKIESGRLQRKN